MSTYFQGATKIAAIVSLAQRTALAMWFLIIATGASIASVCEDFSMRTDVPPVPAGTEMPISISVTVADLMGVDDVGQQLDIDLFVKMEWQDARLVDYVGCRFPITEVWTPRIQLLNSSNLRLAFRNARNDVSIDEGGRVRQIQRATGLISSYHSLRAFPFDEHDFEIMMGKVFDNETKLKFVPDVDDVWISNRLNIEGWDVGGVSLHSRDLVIPATGETIDAAILTINAKRNPEYYIYRALLLLVFVVGMSWVIFWVPPNRFEFQIGIGATSMLTVIAFNLALSGQLPPVGYLTTLDKMVIWAILLIFLSIVEALVAGRMVLKGREALALNIDRACRVVFPVFLVGGWSGIILYG